MSDNFKYLEGKLQDTSDDFYTPAKPQELTKTAVSSLLLTLTSKKTELKSLLIQRAATCERINEIDFKVSKLAIANQFLLSEADSLTVKNAELLSGKKQLQSELKGWKQAVCCLKEEAVKTDQQFRQRKAYILQLQQRQQELRQKQKQKQFQLSNLQDYSMDLQGQIQQAEGQLSKKREERDGMTKMAMTLQTFAKSFRKNLMQKEKELSRLKFQASELDNFIATKAFERNNTDKQAEKSDWQCKMYLHHNQQIQKTNDKLKQDLENLLKHLQSLKKSNRHLSGCIKEYSETGASAAKKILSQSHR